MQTAVIGRHDLSIAEGEEILIALTLAHPGYDSDTTNNDIMLVFLQEPTDQDIDFVKVNDDASSPYVGAPVTVVGWGLTNVDSFDLPDKLMAVDVNAVSNEDCAASEGMIGGWFQSHLKTQLRHFYTYLPTIYLRNDRILLVSRHKSPPKLHDTLDDFVTAEFWPPQLTELP